MKCLYTAMDIGTISELGALESESHGNAVVVNGWISTLTMARIVRWGFFVDFSNLFWLLDSELFPISRKGQNHHCLYVWISPFLAGKVCLEHSIIFSNFTFSNIFCLLEYPTISLLFSFV